MNSTASATSPRDLRPSTGDNGAKSLPSGDKHEGRQNNGRQTYTPIIVGAVVTAVLTILVGIATYTVTNIVNKIDNIEKTIAKHHGPEWAKLESVVEVGKLRSAYLAADNNLKVSLLDKDGELSSAIERRKRAFEEFINKHEQQLAGLQSTMDTQQESIKEKLDEHNTLLRAFESWIDQGDDILSQSQSRETFGEAQLNKQLPDKELGVINLAHEDGYRFSIGDEVVIKNETSGEEQTVSVDITSTFKASNKDKVLIQLSSRAAKAIGFSEREGVIRVSVASQTRRFRTLKDFMASNSSLAEIRTVNR